MMLSQPQNDHIDVNALIALDPQLRPRLTQPTLFYFLINVVCEVAVRFPLHSRQKGNVRITPPAGTQ